MHDQASDGEGIDDSDDHYGLPGAWFVCADESADEDFYQVPPVSRPMWMKGL